MMNVKKIMIATDFTAESEEAFHYAVDLARDHAAKVLIVLGAAGQGLH